MVYDCTDLSSFESAERWMTDLRESARENSPIVLLANKIDCETMEVSKEQGQTLADKFGATFLETSASTGLNVNRAFEVICE